jgi:hypothetical protein
MYADIDMDYKQFVQFFIFSTIKKHEFNIPFN